MRVISLFSGAGGFDIGFSEKPFKIVWAVEKDPSAVETYKTNLGNHIVCADIDSIDIRTVPDCDVIIGGPPCQGFSKAGKMNPKDKRSKLLYSFVKFVSQKLPKYFVMENVDHLLNSPKFEIIRNDILSIFKRCGYHVSYSVIDSSLFGVPQKRKRAIFIGSLKRLVAFPSDIIYPKISSRQAILRLPKYGEPGNNSTCNAKIVLAKNPILRKTAYAGNLFNGAGRPINLDEPSNTIAASIGGNKTPIIETPRLYDPNALSWIESYFQQVSKTRKKINQSIPSTVRRITVEEAAVLQSFPQTFQFLGSQSSRYRQIGNAVPPNLSKFISYLLLKEEELKIEPPILMGYKANMKKK